MIAVYILVLRVSYPTTARLEQSPLLDPWDQICI
jgi:hypothetical protein